jgi:hypothetical protein
MFVHHRVSEYCICATKPKRKRPTVREIEREREGEGDRERGGGEGEGGRGREREGGREGERDLGTGRWIILKCILDKWCLILQSGHKRSGQRPPAHSCKCL